MIAALAAASKPSTSAVGSVSANPSACASASASANDVAGVGHVGEDVVGGAVDDAHHPADAVAGERLAQRADERDATAHRRLEQDVDARALGGLEQLATVGGDELLVRGDHGLAAHERFDDEAPGRFDAADDLHHDVDVGIVDHRRGVVGEAPARQRQVAVLGEVVHRHPGHLERHPGARLDHVGVVVDEAHERAAHVTAAEDPDPYPLVHDLSLPQTRRHVAHATRSSNVSRRTTTRACPSRTNTTAGRGTRL